MKSLISINKKFMNFSPYELINLIKNNSKYVYGIEIYINFYDKNELQYLKDIATLCKQQNLHFQVHGDSTLSIKEQIIFLEIIEDLFNLLNYKINITLHPINSNTYEESVKLTKQYINNILNTIDESKIIIGLENLNQIENTKRLNIEQVIPIITHINKLYMTYDIGHELVDYNNISNLTPNIIPLISNIHIHSINNSYDHMPIFQNDPYWNKIRNAILFLKNNNYDKSIVFEYDLFVCLGNTTKEKIISYCKSIDYVSSKFKKH